MGYEHGKSAREKSLLTDGLFQGWLGTICIVVWASRVSFRRVFFPLEE